MVTPHVLDWLERNGEGDNWMLHVHYWDPHTPYRTPADYESRFQDTPLPDDWIAEDIFQKSICSISAPHGANENQYVERRYLLSSGPKHPGKAGKQKEAAKHLIDLYDDGVRLYGMTISA